MQNFLEWIMETKRQKALGSIKMWKKFRQGIEWKKQCLYEPDRLEQNWKKTWLEQMLNRTRGSSLDIAVKCNLYKDINIALLTNAKYVTHLLLS